MNIELKIKCACGNMEVINIDKYSFYSISENINKSIFKAKQTAPDYTNVTCKCGKTIELYI